MKTAPHLAAGALGALLAIMPLSAAHAQAVEAALERLQQLVSEQGVELDWASADISGSDAVLVEATVGAEGETVPIGNVTLSGIAEIDEGYRIESITVDDYYMSEANNSLSVGGVVVTGVVLPAEGEESLFGGFLFYETADVARVAVVAEGTEVFTLSNFHVEVSEPEGDVPMEFEGAAEEFTIDLSVVEEPAQKAIIQQMGYEQLSGYMELSGSWQPSDGRLTLSQYNLSVVDAGTLGLSLDLGGYTPDFIKALQELQQQMAANPDGDGSAQGLAMLGLMQQLTFHGAEIWFEDDSLTNKVLEVVAQQQGMQPADVANQAKAILPFALAQLNNAELTTMVTQAVSAFLDDPQSLRITAAPAEPVPFALIMAGAMSSPQELPNTLGVTVSANE